MKFIDLEAQYRALEKRIQGRINRVLEHGQYILGPEVQELEAKLANYVGVKHVITCANGTDALILSLRAMGIGTGDAVFCPTFTFFASAEAIAAVGAVPVFVDVDEATFNICPSSLVEAVSLVKKKGCYRAAAVMAVDLFGLPADYDALEEICSSQGLLLIEDAAQGFGGTRGGRTACGFGDVATTSFFPAKPLGCYGDGGAVFTDNDDIADMVRSLRVHGKGADKYDNVRVGMNSRLDTIQAAILLEKLAAFPGELIRRNEAASFYSGLLADVVSVPLVPGGAMSSWAQYTVNAGARRDHVLSCLANSGIPAVVYYAKCLHLQTAFSGLEGIGMDLSRSERLSQSVLSLPMHPYLKESDQKAVVEQLKKALDS